MSILDAMGIGNIQRTFTSFQKSITDVRLAQVARLGPRWVWEQMYLLAVRCFQDSPAVMIVMIFLCEAI